MKLAIITIVLGTAIALATMTAYSAASLQQIITTHNEQIETTLNTIK